MSLLYTMEGMRDLGHTCVVALARPSSPLVDFYSNAGFEVISCQGLALWDHSAVAPRPLWHPFSWLMLSGLMLGWRQTMQSTLALVEKVKPDIVHLNSMPFVASAYALTKAHIPFVWHVREPPPDQGLRTRLIRKVMLRVPQLIFISDFDRQQWVRGKKGAVICNFVDLSHFHPNASAHEVMQSHDVPSDAKVILYLGGISAIKGFYILLDALHLLKKSGLKFICLAPGTYIGAAESSLGRIAESILPLVGYGTPKQQAKKRMEVLSLDAQFVPLPFATDIVPYFSASDVAVFPSIKPHFARPVIESIAMHKPAVGSDIGGVRELLDIHPLAVVVPPGDPVALADGILKVLNTLSSVSSMEAEFSKAKAHFGRHVGVMLINEIYIRLVQDEIQ